MEGWVTLAHLFAFFVVLSSVMTKKLWKNLFQTFVGVGIFTYGYSLLQLHKELDIHQSGVRIDATFGNSTYLAIYMVFLIFFSLLLLSDKEEHSSKPIITSGFIGLGLSFLFPFYHYFSRINEFYRIYSHYPSNEELKASSIFFFTGNLGMAIFWLSIVGLIALSVLWIYEKNFSVKTKALVRYGLYTLVFLSQIYVLYNTATRGAILGLIGGLFLTALIFLFLNKENKNLQNISIGMIVALVVVVGGFYAIKNTDMVKKSPVLSRFSDLSISDKTTQSRFTIWNMAFQGFKEKPIFGWGQESFNYVFNKYYDPKMYANEQWFDRTHNVFFDWLIAGGLLGVISYFALFGLIIYYLWRKDGHFTILEKSLVTGLLAGYMFHNLTVFDNITSYIMFVVLLSWVNSHVGEVPNKLKETVMAMDVGTRDRIIIPVISIATLFVVYLVNVPPILASTELVNAISVQQGGLATNVVHYEKAFSYDTAGRSEILEQIVQNAVSISGAQNVDQKAKGDLFALAQKQLTIQLDRTPTDARYFLFGGSFYASFGDYDNAVKLLTKAHELSEKKQTILFSLGSIYLGKKDYKKAIEIFKQAYDLETTSDEARRIYALGLIYDKQFAKAGEILKPVNPESFIGDQRFISAFFNAGDYDSALAGVNYLLKQNPKNTQLYLGRASIEVASGRITAAIADLNKISELDPASKPQVDKLISQVRAGKGL
jgi:O-antigen ligase/tetratricopeptide (TPR) repeat protein